MPTARHPLLAFIGAPLSSLTTYSLYLFFSRRPSSRFSDASDYAAILASVALGATVVWCAPFALRQRALTAAVYASLFSVVLFFYGFLFLGAVFHDWL